MTWFAGALSLLAAVSVLGGCRSRSGDARKPTAPPFNALGGIRFEEVSAPSGVRFTWPQQPRPLRNLEAFGCGCAFLDYDNDGWQDILLVGSPRVALFHNLRNGRFEDVTARMGLSGVTGQWTGVAVGDYDGDGHLDLLLTGYHRLALLRNVTGKRFVDVTRQAGLDPTNGGHWGSSAGFMDLDGSGRLALVILNYVVFGPKEKQYCELTPGVKSGCPPEFYRSEFPQILRNEGNGRFQDVTASSGLKDTHGAALVLAFADTTGSGRMDFYVGNDTRPADLMRNLGGLRFHNVALQSGVALAGSRGVAAMGADWGDFDRDGRPDLIVTAFSRGTFPLFQNLGDGLFVNVSDSTGLSGPTYKSLGFGAKWIDVDNDGWPDLAFADGHVYDNTDRVDPGTTFREPLMLFHNDGGKRFHDLVPALGGEIARPLLGRGLATGDFDNDGRMDFLVVDYEGHPELFHNVSQTPNHWITLDVRGRAPNLFAYGAQVTARAGKTVWVSQVSPASSYLSSSDPRIHFGLGAVQVLETVTVRWADGHQETLRDVKADQIVRIEEAAR